MRQLLSFRLPVCVAEHIHSELEAVSTIQNVYKIKIGSKWNIYRSGVCSFKFRTSLFWDIIWRGFCEMFYNPQSFHSLCPTQAHLTLWGAPKLSIQCCQYGGICWKGNPLFLLFVRYKAIVTFQHSFDIHICQTELLGPNWYIQQCCFSILYILKGWWP